MFVSVQVYERLMGKALPACQGEWAMLPVTGNDSWRFVAWSWRGPETALIVVNFTDVEGWAQVGMGAAFAPAGGDLVLEDVLTGELYTRDSDSLRNEGLTVGLKPFSVHVFAVRPQGKR